MFYSIWLLAAALAGWVGGKIAGDDGFGTGADILFGLAGAFVVRWSLFCSGNCQNQAITKAGNRSPFPFFSMASTADFANKGSQQELFHEFRLRTIDCAAKVTDAIVASYPKFRGLFDTIHTALPGPSMFNGSVGLAHAEAAYDS